MEETEETTPVRRTRSGVAKSTKAAPASVKKSKPGPLSRKNRRKLDVSDDEDEKIGSAEEKTDTSEENIEKRDEVKESDEKVELNGSNTEKGEKDIVEPEVVLNDAVMIVEEKEGKGNVEKPKEAVEKMEVDEESPQKNKTKEEKKSEPETPNDVTSEKTNGAKGEVTKKENEKADEADVKSTKPEELETSEPDKKKRKLNEELPKKVEKVEETKKEEKIEKPKEEKTEKPKVEKISEEKEGELPKEAKGGENPNEEKKVDKPKEGKKIEQLNEEKKVDLPKEETNVEQSKGEEKVEVSKKKKTEKVETPKEEKVEKLKDDQKEETVEKPQKKDSKTDVEVEKVEIKLDKSDANVKTEGTIKLEIEETKDKVEEKKEPIVDEQKGDPDAENISEDELPTVQAVKVPEAEEVSDEELPGPKRAELPADTEVVSEDELPSVKAEPKKESSKRKLNEADYDPGSPTSENEAPSKKPSLDSSAEKEKEEKPKPKKLPELDKYWKAVNDDPTDFTGWTYLLQYVDQENDMEAAREAYDAFLSHYPYCYGYWRKYADYEKRKGNKKKCEEVFERGLKAIPLSVDLWIHYLTYVKSTRTDDEEFIRSQFERALSACGLEFRSDRLWDSYIKWESEAKRLQKVTAIYDRLLATPTQGYTTHFDNFQEHITSNAPNKVIDVDEFLALRKEVKQQLKHDVTTDAPPADSDAPPGDEDQSKVISSDEETKALRERIISIRRKVHKNTVNAVTVRWNYEEGIKRPYFHVKPLERCQLKNWQDYLDFETEQGDKVRIIVLFERCLIACALYEEFWLKFVHYLETLNDAEYQLKIRDVYERACTIHHLKKPNLHLQWAMFEESVYNLNRAAEILVNLEKSVPNVLQIAYRRINLERRRGDIDKCNQLYEHYINNSRNKVIASSISIKYSRFISAVVKDINKAQEILKAAIAKDSNNPRLYLQLIDLTLQKDGVAEEEVITALNLFLDKDSTDPEQKLLFAQRKLEYLEDFGSGIKAVQEAHDQYQKLLKLNKDILKKKEAKIEIPAPSKSKETKTPPAASQSTSYNYPPYGNSSNPPSYPPYSGAQQGPNYYPQYGQGGDQYQYQNWQYPPQGGYGGYNQWGGYGGGYGY